MPDAVASIDIPEVIDFDMGLLAPDTRVQNGKYQGRTRSGSCVYFIQGRDGGPIKIGKSVFPDGLRRRLADLQTGAPVPLEIRRAVDGGERLEQYLHWVFRDYRLWGEWFSPIPELVKLANANPASDYTYWTTQIEAAEVAARLEAFAEGETEGWRSAGESVGRFLLSDPELRYGVVAVLVERCWYEVKQARRRNLEERWPWPRKPPKRH